uniref:RxLR effector candidate protein n=1 Tax=Hyaloperonospora arabidopsidis (strain Emoy2) TaxID=559515 RepID=M4BTK4_HYAAE
MSPMHNAAHGMEPTAGTRTATGRERASSIQGADLEVKAEAMPRNTEQKLVDLLTGLAELMTKLEASQEAKNQPTDKESSVFGSAKGLGQPMNRRALDVTPPINSVTTNVARDILRVNQLGYASAAENVEMAQALQPGLPQHFVPPPVYQQAPIPQHAASYARLSEARQRKLNIRHFDGKKLYQGIGGGFLSWEKKFVREVSFAE